jgi:DNA-binding MarR family transcriptional regulator
MMSSTMPAGCWDLDLATGMLNLCGYSRRMFGLSPDCSDLLTESEWVDRLHPDDLTAVRQALTACLVNRAPYAQRFRTIHPDGSVQDVLGVGRPVEDRGEHGRFVGWNVDLVSAGDVAGEWILSHPEALGGEHPASVQSVPPPTLEQPADAMSPQALVERAQAILRVRQSRDRLLGRAMIGEPAYDLLLALYLTPDTEVTSLASLAKSAAVPYSSAGRWIAYLVDKGFVSRRQSSSDRRVTSVHLTRAGRAVLDEFLAIR